MKYLTMSELENYFDIDFEEYHHHDTSKQKDKKLQKVTLQQVNSLQFEAVRSVYHIDPF